MAFLKYRVVQALDTEPTTFKKDIHWYIDETTYVIRNVPYLKSDYDGEELLDLEVSITVTALCDLMIVDAIPHDIVYEDFADIEYE